MKSLTFDIETIPQRAPLSEIQQEELTKKINRYMARRPEEDEEEVKNLIMGTSPYFGEIVTIGLYFNDSDGDESTALIGDEEEILNRFWTILNKFKGVFVSYNGLTFDIPFILKRSMKYKILPTNREFLKTRRYTTYPHFDVKEVIADFNKYEAPTLHLACEHLGIPSPKEGEVKANEVAQAFADGRIQEIADYCVRDVIATFKVFERINSYR
jgi:predicted PolB exonuclease-like 3'-5' exonuclease